MTRIKNVFLCVFGFLFSTSCQSTFNRSAYDRTQGGRYPQIWWEEILKKDAPEWEIFPQDALLNEVILSKRTELGILSNFANTPFTYRGKTYASIEGFWQMLKFPELKNDERIHQDTKWNYTREQVSSLSSFAAKAAGTEASQNMKTLGIDWVTFEGKKINYRENKKGEFYQLIKEVMLEKIKQNSNVKKILLQTGDLRLMPDHLQEPNSPPAWKYFEIWSEIREDLKKGGI